jgi:hypothetical protein
LTTSKRCSNKYKYIPSLQTREGKEEERGSQSANIHIKRKKKHVHLEHQLLLWEYKSAHAAPGKT